MNAEKHEPGALSGRAIPSGRHWSRSWGPHRARGGGPRRRSRCSCWSSLHRRFDAAPPGAAARARAQRQEELDAGVLPDFLAETAEVRAGNWRIAPVPEDLRDRRVEITGPIDRKMVINALNAPVSAFMADFEDSCSPTWDNIVRGQINLRDAVRRTISYVDPADRQHLSARRTHRDADRAPARLAPAGEARAHRRRAGIGRAVRLRAVPRQQPRGAGPRAAPDRTSICRSSRAISRRGCGTTCSSRRRTRSDCRAAPSRRRC